MWHNSHMQVEKTVEKNYTKRNYLGVLLAFLLALGAFFSGIQYNAISGKGQLSSGSLSLFAGGPAVASDVDMSEFWKVWQLLDQKYAKTASSSEPLTPAEKIQGAITGLVKAYGDPYTTYFPPAESSSFNEDIAGNFSGVGMEVGMRDGLITIISPLPGTPAEKAGILSGDILVSINGTSTNGMDIDAAVKLIRGPEGTVVNISIYRKGDKEPKDIAVTRAKIEIPNIKTEKKGDVFVIALYSFNALAEQKMQEAMQEFEKSGSKKLVLDLRGNPGGYLQGAVAIASYFLPSGKVVVRESFSGDKPEEVYRSSGKVVKNLTDKEMVVLIDGGSASASEILAGALAQHNVSTLIGNDSFGKGSVQELVDLQNGSSLKVTIARWLTPDGTSISLKGLKPKYVVDRTPEQRIEKIDPQMDAALDFLAGRAVKVSTSTATSTKLVN